MQIAPPRLILASASPRRLALLRRLGADPLVIRPGVDERPHPGEAPRERVQRLAEAKARCVASAAATPLAVVLAADTEVVLDGEPLGKPATRAEAAAMLARLRGRSHDVLTAVFLIRTDDGRSAGGIEATRVRFRRYDDATLRWYVASGEPLDKAGGYAIQGRGALLVRSVAGSWFNVVGLPVERLAGWLGRIGLDILQLVEPRPAGRAGDDDG